MKKKILIVDDDPDMRTYLESVLAEHGFDTKTAKDGVEGLDTARSFRPDVITLDIMMEHETGLKFYRNAVADTELRSVPVIIVSGVSSYKPLFARDHASMPKPFAFLEKPIEPRDLLALIEKAIHPTPSH